MESGSIAGTEIGVDAFDGFGDLVIHAGAGGGDNELGFDDASDGGGGQAEGTQDIGELVDIRFGVNGFDQAPRKDTDEGNLFDQSGGFGGFDPGEVMFAETAGVEAVFEGVEVAFGGAAGRLGVGSMGFLGCVVSN